MKITRITRIKGHRIFENFAWPSDLPDFSRFNLIYGWNGSGKTTLSNLMRHIQLKESVSEGEVDFQIDGNPTPGASLAAAVGLPRVRVFNREFVDANVFNSWGAFEPPKQSIIQVVHTISPIFFLGKDSVEKQKQVEDLNKAKQEDQQKLDEKTKAKTKAVKALDDFCISEAKGVKELLSSSGANSYNNYDKSHFKSICTRLAQLDPPPVALTDDEKNRLKKQKDGTPKEAIVPFDIPLDYLEEKRPKAEGLLQRTVVSQVLQELAGDGSLAEWVRQGLTHHTGEKHSDKCRFCGSQIPGERIAKLEAHFNDEYRRFSEELNAATLAIMEARQYLAEPQLPDKAKFYEHLVPDYLKAVESLKGYLADGTAYLLQIEKALLIKRSQPFKSLALAPYLEGVKQPDIANATALVKSINDLIERHNNETENFHKVVADARKRLEEALATDALPEFKKKTAAIRTLDLEFPILQAAIKDASDKVAALEKEIIEHRRPADELNAELRSYLGRDELKFDFYENGYQITRHGVPAKNLSEGERTAIAFLYFLKSLQAKDFSIADDIVVVDDPVSSLDANALFCSFGYMKDRTKDAGQLFILTHNFGFFRQVKNWFNHLKHQGSKDITKQSGRFYMIETEIVAGKRSAAIKQLDPLLHRFESEYHYLFKKVHDEANKSVANRSLEEYYGMPNIARRLLESFLSFRYPAESGELKQQLDAVAFDPAKKARILRFLHTYSHDGKIAEPEHDLSILAETPDVLKDLLELLNTEDPKHCTEMSKLLANAGAAT